MAVAMRDFFTCLAIRDMAERSKSSWLTLHIYARWIGATAHLPERDLRFEYERDAPTLAASATAGNIAIAIIRIACTNM
jgi:hypothetical protein